MLDMHSDPTAFTAAFGCHIVQTEPDDLLRLQRSVNDAEIERKKTAILDMFVTPDPESDPITRKLTDEDLHVAARVAVALDKFVEEYDLDGLAYYYEAEEGSEMRRLVTNLIVGNSLLTAAGFPMCGESDLKTCIAMLIEDRLDIGGSFAEFHPIDFREGFVLVGHDGPHHINIADGKPVLRSLAKYHGKPGSGASVEFKIKEGPITMLSIGQTADGRFKFVIGEGESVAGPIPPRKNPIPPSARIRSSYCWHQSSMRCNKTCCCFSRSPTVWRTWPACTRRRAWPSSGSTPTMSGTTPTTGRR